MKRLLDKLPLCATWTAQLGQKATEHFGTFGFTRHTNQRFAKPKEPKFSQPNILSTTG